MEPMWLFEEPSLAMEGATRDAKRTLKELKRDIKAERKLMLDCDKKGNYDEALYHAEACLKCSEEALAYVSTLRSSVPMKIGLELVNFILSGALRAAAFIAFSGFLMGIMHEAAHPSNGDFEETVEECLKLAKRWCGVVTPYAIGAGYLVSGVHAAKYKVFQLINNLGKRDERSYADKTGNSIINACRSDIESMVTEYQNCVEVYRMKQENCWRFN